MNHLVKNICISIALTASLLSPSAFAQATRTWVSGVGDDANPCSRTAPCKTFAGAISKTAAFGEISVLDPGGFGVVTITKSITLNGDGVLAGILASGTNGIIVNAAAADTVILRNLSINGFGTGLNGIRYLKGGSLIVDGVSINGFIQNGIDVNHSENANLVVKNSTISDITQSGVKINSVGTLAASLNHVSIQGADKGIETFKGATQVSNSIITQNFNFGVHAQGSSTLSVESSMLTANGVAAQAETGATVRLINNDIFDNLKGFGCGSGTLASTGDNRKAGNSGGVGPSCAPNATITVQ
ncbi:MAG: right-handed parallel beta-helix repeat-containing protein [Methylomicrobium sp.]